MKRSPKTELFEDGLQSGTFRERCFSVLVWTWIFLKTDKKSLSSRFQLKSWLNLVLALCLHQIHDHEWL